MESIDEAKKKARKRFIDHFSRLATVAITGKEPKELSNVNNAYLELAISDCMDAAIFNMKKLDVHCDPDYKL